MKIQLKTIDLSTRLRGITTEFVWFIPQSLVLRSIVSGSILMYQNWAVLHFLLSLVSIGKIYRTPISKRLEARQNSAVCRIFICLLDTRKCGQTRSFVSGSMLFILKHCQGNRKWMELCFKLQLIFILILGLHCYETPSIFSDMLKRSRLVVQEVEKWSGRIDEWLK